MKCKYKEDAGDFKIRNIILAMRDRNILRQANAFIIKTVLQERVSCLWEDEWAMRHERSYEHLRGTQLLKRIIVKDKMKFLLFSLNHVGLTAGEHKTEDIKPERLAQFVILRDAIQHRSRQYLERLMEYQSLFNKTLDIGIKDFPVPSLERRREIGIYMDFLNDRIKGVRKQIDHLICRLFKNSGLHSLQKRNRDILLHSWKHHFTSEHHFQKDNIKKECNVHHITTNYWMPERVDLQPLIAHEISHLIVHQYFDHLSDTFFQYAEKSNFAELLRSMFRVCRRYDTKMGLEKASRSHRPRFLVSEIACDLLASSVKGFSYLYASLLEATGNELYKLLLSGNRDFDIDPVNIIDLDMIHFLAGRDAVQRRDWWLRLKIMICWLREIHHVDEGMSKLDKILLEGTDCLLDNLIIFLDEITPDGEAKTGAAWRSLAERLCEEIKSSDAVNDVKQWRRDRFAAAQWNDENDDDQKQTEEIFPRSVKRLHPEVVETLKKIHAGIKTKPWNALFNFKGNKGKESLEDKFDLEYLINKEGKCSERFIYNHLYDIPWKCSLSRSIDVFQNNSSQKRMLDFLSDNAIGQELHSIALEFHIMLNENPIDRLTHIMQLINHDEKLKHYFEGVNVENDDSWYKSAKTTLGKSKAERERKEVGNKQKIKKLEEKAEKLLGRVLEDREAKNHSLWNYISCHTDKDKIFPLLLDEITHIHTKTRCCSVEGKIYRNPINHLDLVISKIKNKNDQLEGTEEKKVNDWVKKAEVIKESDEKEARMQKAKRLLQDIPDCPDKEKLLDNKVRCFRMLLVSRYIAGGFYRMQDDQENIFTDKKNLNAVSLLTGGSYWFHPKEKEDLKQDKEWQCCYPRNDRKYANLCGRYDAMSFVRTRPIHSCIIPHFEEHFQDDNDGKNLSEYSFPSILTRREFGLKVDLSFDNDCQSYITRENNKETDLLAGYISVVLKRRSLRIPFLARLLASVNLEDQGSSNPKQDKLREYIQKEDKINNCLKKNDIALLLDGSADFLLVLRRDQDKDNLLDRVENLMNLAYWLHQDFMVDRTEIILSAAALDKVAEDIATGCVKFEKCRYNLCERHYQSEYSLECEIRCFEDRFLDDSLADFIQGIKAGIKRSRNEEGGLDRELLVTVEIAAGRKDVLLRFFNKGVEDLAHAELWKFADFREGLRKLLQQDKDGNSRYDFVDRIEVNVNKAAPEPEKQTAS